MVGLTSDRPNADTSKGEDDWQKFWETTLAIDQKEREPAGQALCGLGQINFNLNRKPNNNC